MDIFNLLAVLIEPAREFVPIQPWLAKALLLASAGAFTRRQMRRLKWKLAWEMIRQKFSFKRSGKKNRKIKWGLVILFALIIGGTLWLCFAAGVGGALIKTIGITVAILGAISLYAIIFGGWSV